MSGVGDTWSRRHLLQATGGAAAGLLIAPWGTLQAASGDASTRDTLEESFDAHWRFHRGELDGAEAATFDDHDWRSVDLPHDWSIEDLPAATGDQIGPFNHKAIGGSATGYSIGGEGWYRKQFHLPNHAATRRVELLFEGVYMNADVWLNGQLLASHGYGYTPFAIDLGKHLSANGSNVLAVRVRNLGQNSRWYSGSGIYRHVWLKQWPERARIGRWGVAVVTVQADAASAEIKVSTQLEGAEQDASLSHRIVDGGDRVVLQRSGPVGSMRELSLTVLNPALWSPDAPHVYTLETELRRGDRVLDVTRQTFGIRVVSFDAERGMLVNGLAMKLRGGCIHHDNGLLGAAAFDAAEERKVRLLKARGFNAVRPSHNPFSPAFLHACDRLGVFVIGETFDAWHEHKLPQDYASIFDNDWRADLTALVLSARNHPSIVMWSIGNEIPGRGTPEGIRTQWQLANEVHRLDPTRPVTAAINSFVGHPVKASAASVRPGAELVDASASIFLDVVGYNYKLADYETDHQQYPHRLFVGTESYALDTAAIWDLTERSPWLLGDFVWTAMDYLGEAGIGGSAVLGEKFAFSSAPRLGTWPWVNAYCGDIDLIGQQKAPSLVRDIVWGRSTLELAVQRPVPAGKADVPTTWGWHDEHDSWTWPGAEGESLTVRLYTSGDRVELHQDGQRLESRSVSRTGRLLQIEFAVTYRAGTLEAVAYRGGQEIGRRQLKTVGAPAACRLSAEAPKGGAARGDVSFVSIEVIDPEGRRVPDVAKQITLTITGPAELIGLGSACPFAVGSFQSSSAQTWDGRALAVLRSKGTGMVTISVSGDGLASAATQLRLG